MIRRWLALLVIVSVIGCGRPPAAPSTTNASPVTFNGTYTGPATTSDFAFCGMSQSQQLRGVLSVDAKGSGTWTVTEVDRSLTLRAASVVFTVDQNVARFTASGSEVINGNSFRITSDARIENKSLSLTLVFTRSDSGCAYTYQATLTAA